MRVPIPPLIALLALAACKPDPETITRTETITKTNTITNTVIDTQIVTDPTTITVTDPDLEPGHFEEVLVEIQELVGRGGALGTNGSGETHMHISEMAYRPGDGTTWPDALFYCSYTFGVLDATNKNSMPFMAQGFKFLPRTGTRDPGCINMAFDEDDMDIVYATHHGNLDDGISFLSGFDLNSTATDPYNPTKLTLAPIQLPMVQETGEVYEGMDVENGMIFVTTHETGMGVFQRDALNGNAINRIATISTGLQNAWDVAVDDDVAYVCDAEAGLVVLDVSDVQNAQEIGRLEFGGLCHQLSLNDAGDVLYIAAESDGFYSVDVSDPTNPTTLDNVNTGTSVVYVNTDANYLYVAAWNDTRVYDVTDPANIEIIGAVRETKQKNYSADGGDEGERPDITNRVLGVDGVGEYVFSGTWWVPHNYLLHPDNTAPYIVLPEALNYLTIPGELAVGESATADIVIRNDGNETLTVFDIWMTNPAFTVSPDELQIPPGGSGTVTLTFTATIGAGTSTSVTSYGTVVNQTGQEESFIQIWSDDPSQPLREGYVVGNPKGLAVGDAYYNNATLLDGTPWSFEDDALGQVTLISYFATF